MINIDNAYISEVYGVDSVVDTIPHKNVLKELLNISVNGYEKFYEDFDGLILSPDEINAHRNSLHFREGNKIWGKNRFNSHRNIGGCMTIAHTQNKTDIPSLSTMYEAYKKAFENRDYSFDFTAAKPNESLVDYFNRMAEGWGKAHPSDDERIPLTEIIIRVIIETFEGYIGELLAWSLLQENLGGLEEYAGYPEGSLRLVETTPMFDNAYNVDILVYNNLKGRIEFGVQVKSKSYFNRNKITEASKQQNKAKDERLYNEYGVNNYYMDKSKEELVLITADSIPSSYTGNPKWNTIEKNEMGKFVRVSRTPDYYGYIDRNGYVIAR